MRNTARLMKTDANGKSRCGTSHSAVRAPHLRRAFTLIEMLVVIAIIGILAGLILGVLPAVQEKKIRGRVHAELEAVATVIESYKEKKGFYPPENLKSPDLPALYYELTSSAIPGPSLAAADSFGINTNIVNFASEDAHNFYPNVRPTQISTINGVSFLAVQARGVNDENMVTWRYRAGTNAVHNHDAFDLWADVKIGNKNIAIGNWSD